MISLLNPFLISSENLKILDLKKISELLNSINTFRRYVFQRFTMTFIVSKLKIKNIHVDYLNVNHPIFDLSTEDSKFDLKGICSLPLMPITG